MPLLRSGSAGADVGAGAVDERDGGDDRASGVGIHQRRWRGELRDAGYETHLSGKLHLQPTRRRFGFDAMDLAEQLARPATTIT